MNIPTDLRYTDTHEWLRREPDGILTLGITDHAQEQLGDVVFVGDAKVGATLAAGAAAAVVESVKAASDIYLPLDGEVVAFNTALESAPEQINRSPYEAWILRFRPSNPGDLDRLLDAGGYASLVGKG